MSLLIDITKTVQGKSIRKAPKEVQESRINTCEYCPFLQWNKPRSCGKFMVGGEIEYNGKHFKLCGCDVDDKVKYLDDSCPLGKW